MICEASHPCREDAAWHMLGARVLAAEMCALDEHLQARIMENIESLDTLRASLQMGIFREV